MNNSRLPVIMCSMVILLAVSSAFAGVPQKLNYQGHLVDNVGEPITGTVSMTFTIYDGETGGLSLWSEPHPTVSVEDGGFSVVLGNFVAIDDIVFEGEDRWLEITVDGQTISPRTIFTSMPYSYRVSTIDGASAGAIVGDFQVTPSAKDLLWQDPKHAGLPKIEIGSNFTIYGAGRPGSLHLHDLTQTTTIDLDGVTSSVGIGTDNMKANLHVNGDLYTLGGDGDINTDGTLTIADLTTYIAYLYMGGPVSEEGYANGDIDGDGRVNSDDIAMFVMVHFTGSTKGDAVRNVHAIYGASPDASNPHSFYVNGNCGIGSQNPTEKFHVLWDPNVDAELGRGTTDTDITFLSLRNANGTKVFIYPDPTGTTLLVSTTKP